MPAEAAVYLKLFKIYKELKRQNDCHNPKEYFGKFPATLMKKIKLSYQVIICVPEIRRVT